MPVSTRTRHRIDPTGAKAKLKRKAGTLDGMYYAVGIEVPPRQGATYSLRFTTVPSARAGEKLLREKLAKKKRGMTGTLVVALEHTSHSVELAAAVHAGGGKVDVLYPSHTVGDVRRRVARETARNRKG